MKNKTRVIFLVGILGSVSGLIYLATLFSSTPATAHAKDAKEAENQVTEVPVSLDQDEPVPVKVIHPRKGAMPRTTALPGSVQAYQSVPLYSQVQGILKTQDVDIGDRVKKDQILAVVDVPDLEQQVLRNSAAVEQAKAKVLQMTARMAVAHADLEAAGAEVTQTEATAKSSAAWVRFRTVQYQRMKDLFATNSIEEKLVDENKERYEASVETENAARAAVVTTKAKVVACTAKIQQAEADVAAAQSEVKLAQAELGKSQVMVDFATIRAPFNGVVTFRSLDPKAFVRAANQSGSQPLLIVQRTDLMRVIVQVPDRDVILVDPGDPATLEIDALPGLKFQAPVSRKAQSQDPKTRLMRVEIDLPNPTGKINDGMYAHVTIELDKAADKLSIPTPCLVSKSSDGTKGTVFVVRDGHARQESILLGEDSGLRVTVVEGIDAKDLVVMNPGNALTDNTEVTATLWNETPAKSSR